MSQSNEGAHVDPHKLEQFAQSLAGHIRWYQDAMARSESWLNHLGRTWRDQEFEEFKLEFDRARYAVLAFVSEAENTRKIIQGDADRAREYQRIRN
jgi:uncharacterized protein YukE